MSDFLSNIRPRRAQACKKVLWLTRSWVHTADGLDTVVFDYSKAFLDLVAGSIPTRKQIKEKTKLEQNKNKN